jgi:citrate synthase
MPTGRERPHRAVSLLRVSDQEENYDSPAATRAKALRLLARMRTVIALDQRRRLGLGPVPPRNDLGFATNFVHMSFGEGPEPAMVALVGV